MRVRYSKSLNVSNKVFGLLFAAAGFIPIIIMVVMIVLARAEDSKIPDDAEWYTDGGLSETLLPRQACHGASQHAWVPVLTDQSRAPPQCR